MRLSLSILGTEVVGLRWGDCGCDRDDDGTAEEEAAILGGSSHDFERDTAPLDPADHYGEWEDRKRFGFGGLS